MDKHKDEKMIPKKAGVDLINANDEMNKEPKIDTAKIEQIKRKKWVLVLCTLLIGIVASVLFVKVSSAFETERSKVTIIDTVNTLTESYQSTMETEQVLTNFLLLSCQTESEAVLQMISDYQLYNLSRKERLNHVETLRSVLSKTNGREVFLIDEKGSLFLTTTNDALDSNIVQLGYFSKEELEEQINLAQQIQEDPEAQNKVTISFNQALGYYYCRQVCKKDGTPSPYYMIIVYDSDQIDEVIKTSVDRTVLASALSTNSMLMALSIYSEEEFLYSTIKNVGTYRPVLLDENGEAFTDDTALAAGKWLELRLVPKSGSDETISYPETYARSVIDPLGNKLYVVGSFTQFENPDESVRLIGAAIAATLVLLALMLMNIVYFLFCYKSSILVSRYTVLSAGVTFVSIILFAVTIYYFQSVEDLTEIAISAEEVQTEITEMKAYEREQYEKITEYFKYSELRQMSLIAYDLESSEDQFNDADRRKIYYSTGKDGHYEPIRDSLGNIMTCTAGSQLLSSKEFKMEQANLWLINDLGYAVASSSESDWSMNTNQMEEGELVRQVLRGTSSYVYENVKDESGLVMSTTIVYPMALYMKTGKSGFTVYLSREQYQKVVEAGKAEEYGVKKLDGALLVRVQVEPEALQLCRETFEADMAIIANQTYTNIVPLEKLENNTMIAGDGIIYSGRDNLDLKEVVVPASGASQKIFNFFRTISRIKCYFYVTNDFSQGDSTALCYTKDLVHNQRTYMVTVYTILSALALICNWVVFRVGKKYFNKEMEAVLGDSFNAFFKEKKKEPSGVLSKENTIGDRGDYLNFALRVLKKADRFGLKAESVTMLLIQVVLLLCGGLIVNDLFLTKQYGSNTLFINIYSAEWERCFNYYNLVAMLALFLINITVFSLVRSIVELFCVPFGGKVATYAKLIVSVIQYVLMFIGIFYGAYLMGMELKSLGTMATVIAGVIGIGSQALISDIGSGIAILAEGRYMIGDLVQVDAFVGRIRDIGVRNCILVNDQNVEKSVSNSRMNNAILLTNRVTRDEGEAEEEETEEEETEERTGRPVERESKRSRRGDVQGN